MISWLQYISLNYICKNPFSKSDHVARSWGLGHGQIVRETTIWATAGGLEEVIYPKVKSLAGSVNQSFAER